MNVISALIIGIAIVLGGFLVGGRYDSHYAHDRAAVTVVIVDRFTGTARACDVTGCGELRDRNTN